ncbi:unnamed protein product [Cryptosporidium hominis]|uniref:Uncharacterized protein n=2 Tax=Cryptosporidium hominis TaxID=237895 RepID=A0A0S4TC94_CRYHO|nr:hypothetical protein [Cryptosporidium hominis TU502]CUV04103.1 unnamed protein product [Cryptosporidium hominis]
MIMEHDSNYGCSGENGRIYASVGYESCNGGITEGNLQVSHSNQHINIDDIRNISPQKIICENSSCFNNNDNNNLYEPVNLTNSFMDHRESGSLPTIRRNSMRGRRRYRRTLLRNYEQPLGQNSHGNQTYIEQCDDFESNNQRRVYLRNPNIGGANGGMNYSSFKFNSNFDNYSKVSKPSWDGGRLVKLLQGHGLNIENYEKENESLLNKSWGSKQINTQNSQLSSISNNKDFSTSAVLNGQSYVQLSHIYHGVNLKVCDVVDHQKISNTKNIRNFPSYANDQKDSFGLCHKETLIHEGNPLNQINHLEKKVFLQDNLTEGDSISNESLETQKTDRFALVSSLENQHLLKSNQNIEDSSNIIGIAHKNSLFNLYESSKESYFNSERKYSITSLIPSMEKQVVNIDNQLSFNMEEHESEHASNSTYCDLNHSLYNISQEELFITLGDTPTSKSNYNISTIFVPNQDS